MLIVMFAVSLFIRKILYSFICRKRLIPSTKEKSNPFFHFNCDVCGFTLYSKEYLKLHLTKYMDFKKEKCPKSVLHVNCDVCGFTFYSKEYLKLHPTKYMDFKREKIPKSVLHVNCDVCGFTFHSKDFI